MRDGNRAAVVLFRGDPRREERQKRLPPRFLATLHDELLALLRTLPSVDVLTATGLDGDGLTLDGADRQLVVPAVSLAERIEAALSFCFAAGYERVLLLAGDIATLQRDAMDRALAELRSEQSVAVIGQSSDGGFYLAGFNAPPRVAWADVLRNRGSAADALLGQLRAEDVTIAMMPVVDDIDQRSDALRVAGSKSVSSAVRRLLDRLASLLFSPGAPQPIRAQHRFARHAARQLRAPPLLPAR